LLFSQSPRFKSRRARLTGWYLEDADAGDNIRGRANYHLLNGQSTEYQQDMEKLRRRFQKHLRQIGYRKRGYEWIPPPLSDKELIRKLARPAVERRIQRASRTLRPKEEALLEWIADGQDISLKRIAPRLLPIRPGSEEELVFRYATHHWSIPVSSGYGRRLRFLMIDEENDKLMGVIGLGDPVYNLSPRDRWIGWSDEKKRSRLHSCLDAFVLGAVPPYSHLLCGKFMAMTIASKEVRTHYNRSYLHPKSIISGSRSSAPLALVTTLSALGKSSVYDRVKLSSNHAILLRIGTTAGTGDFHLNNSLYAEILDFIKEHHPDSYKNKKWGEGFRNRREVMLKFLSAAGLSRSILTHGIPREIYAAPTARNSLEFLRGETTDLDFYDWTVDDLFDDFKARWMLPRAAKRKDYLKFRASSWRLWTK
jgi:hypothetical protein